MNTLEDAARAAEARLAKAGLRVTLGGEPTFVPERPRGPEWSYAATGPGKLRHAQAIARHLLAGPMAGGIAVFSPGKLYPGEPNPRWAIKLVARRDGAPLTGSAPQRAARGRGNLAAFTSALNRVLGVRAKWAVFKDPGDEGHQVMALPLDHDGAQWSAHDWKLAAADRQLSRAEGPAGLRLPLDKLPRGVTRRVLTASWSGRERSIFFPPLLQAPFLELLAAIAQAAAATGAGAIEHTGYVPDDTAGVWVVAGLTADPGVLEVNLPACTGWAAYRDWLEAVCEACAKAGLRPWKEQGFPEGTGGGNHILWGGASLDTNPFFVRPRWLAAILRVWQRHPALSYLFTGRYVGPSSQAPRPDESGHGLHDLEMACAFLERLPPGDHRTLINEALRHLHTDASGNTHRSEISFDKFWNPDWPGGSAGLIEFRAVESLPSARWMSAVGVLWLCVAAHAAELRPRGGLRDFGRALHDRFLLPAFLWEDLLALLGKLEAAGCALPAAVFREIWDWRFPELLAWGPSRAGLRIRRALEVWPLLSEMPIEGGTTSRFVDASLRRLEFHAEKDFVDRYAIHVAGRPLSQFHALPGGSCVAGLRYRQTQLRPSLHPGIPPHTPLAVCLLDRRTHRAVAEFVIASDDAPASETPANSSRQLLGNPLRPLVRGDVTLDLRM